MRFAKRYWQLILWIVDYVLTTEYRSYRYKFTLGIICSW